MTRRRVLAAAAIVTVLVVIGGAWFLWPRGTTTVSEQDARDDFRTRSAAPDSDDSPDHDPRQASEGVPAPGVYTYEATGQEKVKLGPLPAETRPLPDTVTAVAVDLGDGCFDWTVNLFAEHTEDTRYCSDGGAFRTDSHTKHQSIGALSPTATVDCDPDTLVGPGGPTSTLQCDLALSGAPVTIAATLSGTATTDVPETRTVGSTEVEVTPVTVDYAVTGDLEGTWSETLWLTEDHLPVQVERTLDLSGPARFSEQSTLELVDLTPAT